MSATPVLASIPEIQPASRQKCRHATRSTAHAEAIAGYVLAAPTFLLIGFLILLPLLAVLGVAVTDWEFGARSFNFVGVDNFRELIGDATFDAALRNTLHYVAVTVPGTTILGLSIALLIESGSSLRAFCGAAHFRAAADNSRVDVHGMNMIDFDSYDGRQVTRGAVAVAGNVPNGMVMR
jgi:hypothetical protein